jgi:hypothetical protein
MVCSGLDIAVITPRFAMYPVGYTSAFSALRCFAKIFSNFMILTLVPDINRELHGDTCLREFLILDKTTRF